MTLITVLVVDHNAACREALRAILEQAEGLTVVGEASDGPESVEAALRLCPDVVVMDVQVPGLDGIEVTKALGCCRQRPAVVCLTVYPTRHDEACAAGVAHFMLKDSPANSLIQAVRAAARPHPPELG